MFWPAHVQVLVIVKLNLITKQLLDSSLVLLLAPLITMPKMYIQIITIFFKEKVCEYRQMKRSSYIANTKAKHMEHCYALLTPFPREPSELALFGSFRCCLIDSRRSDQGNSHRRPVGFR